MLIYIYEVIYETIYFMLAFFYPHYELHKQAVIYVYIYREDSISFILIY